MSTELENLIVRLTGDASSYLQSMQRSEEAAISFGQTAESVAQGAVQAFTALGVGAWAHEALHNWQEQESANLKLEAALRAAGRQVETLMQQYSDFASQMQETTVLADEVVINFLRQAESFGLTGDAAMSATRAAIALAGAVDGTAQSAASYIKFAAAMQKGDIALAQHMARLIPQLRGIKDQTEFVAKANQLMASGLATVGAEAKSTAGVMAMLKNAYGDFLEEIGKVIAGGLRAFVADVRNVVRWMASWDESTKSAIATAAALGAAFLAMLPTLKLLGFLFGSIFSPLSVILAGITAATATWVESVGGLGKAWETARNAAVAAWDWLEPVRGALASFWDAAKEIAAAFWDDLKTVAAGVWESIGGKANITWEQVRDFAVNAIIRAEFALRNLDKMFEVWGANAKVIAGTIADDFMRGVQTIQAGFSALFDGIAAFFQNISWYELLTGDAEGIARGAAEAAKAFTDGFSNAMAGVSEDSAFTKQAKQDLARLQQELGGAFDEFQQKKLKDLVGGGKNKAVEQEQQKAADAFGGMVGKSVAKHTKKEIEKIDAALFGSAEAESRMEAFNQMLAGKDKSEEYLKEIRDIAKKDSSKPVVQLAAADV